MLCFFEGAIEDIDTTQNR